MTNSHDTRNDQPVLAEDVGPACPLGTCGSGRWILWGGLIALGVLYLYSNRTSPAAFQWVTDPSAGLAQAKQTGRPLLMDFYADWCGVCKAMDREVYSRRDVARAVKDWIPVRVNVDRHSDLAEMYNIEALPTVVLLSPDGKVIDRREGWVSADELIKLLRTHATAWPASQPTRTP